MNTIRTRFAPSPTGYLHIGGLRTALYAYLHAKQNNGTFILRIEDTDQARLIEDSLQNIIDTLAWAGLEFEEGPGKGGSSGPYIQSERLDIYQKHVQQLLDSEHAYRCFCTKEQLDTMREEQMAAKQAPMYDRRCRYLSTEEIQEKLDSKTTFVIRQAVPLKRLVKFKDKIRGNVTFDTNTLDDHVLLKTDGFPTYHFAVVIDDHYMQITDVIRGEEWLPSTPKHILLYEAFGWQPTEFAHLPLLLNKDRSKLSKRQNDVSTQSYIDKGYSKEALINFIALLGWNTSDNQELFSIQDLLQKFSLDRVQKSGAIFDLDKLNWYNWQWKRNTYLKEISAIAKEIDSKVEIIEPKKGHLKFNFSSSEFENKFLQSNYSILYKIVENHLSEENKTQLATSSLDAAKILKTVEEKILKEPENINQFIEFIFQSKFDYNSELFLNEKMNVSSEVAKNAIQKSIEMLSEADFQTEELLLIKFKEIIANLEYKNGQVLWPVRIALTNEEYSPGVFEIASILGYKNTIQKLTNSLNSI
jgi:glutamyl-tRNA synthetase